MKRKRNSSNWSIVLFWPNLKSWIIQNSDRWLICSTFNGRSLVKARDLISQFVKPSCRWDGKDDEVGAALAAAVRERPSFDATIRKICINKPELILNASEKKTMPSLCLLWSKRTIDLSGRPFVAGEKNEMDDVCTGRNETGWRSRERSRKNAEFTVWLAARNWSFNDKARGWGSSTNSILIQLP